MKGGSAFIEESIDGREHREEGEQERERSVEIVCVIEVGGEEEGEGKDCGLAIRGGDRE